MSVPFDVEMKHLEKAYDSLMSVLDNKLIHDDVNIAVVATAIARAKIRMRRQELYEENVGALFGED